MPIKQIFYRSALLLFFVLPFHNFASKTESGFEALSVYDYFKAKQLFYKDLKKNTAYCAYGLATIYSRSDNPFYNLDSASKFAGLGFNSYRTLHAPKTYFGFIIDSISILKLCDTIAYKSFEKVKKKSSVQSLDKFILQNYLASNSLIKEAIYLRDELEFNSTIEDNNSDSTQLFITLHPQSSFLSEALLLKDRQLFDEQTKKHNEQQYLTFIQKYPDNVMINNAYESLYTIYRETSNAEGLKHFVENYPKAPQVTEAWKLLFSLTVKSFSNNELEKFLSEYPKFPFKNSILKELELNKLVLYPYQNEDLFGFIDSTARLAIRPEYDAVSDFSEGLAVVNRNDSAFFINKENENAFKQYYSDAFPFKNGIAVVKVNNKWGFINRQGQGVEFYDEINELSNNAYVIKDHTKYGAIDHFGQSIIEPRFDKLGDFKNEFAYYIENGKYGFVSKKGYVYKAEFDWISDFNEKNIAIFRQNNAYGLVNSQGIKIMEAQYDQILKATNNIFIVVKNGLYGFYNGNGCYLSPVAYDFIKEKPAEFYTNGNILKLLKKNEQAFMDLNGKTNIDFGVYDEINFASNSLIKVKRKNKYGYLDRKLNPVIQYKYQEAKDFSDSLAIVKLKENTILINTTGKEIYTTTGTIEKLSTHYYLVEEEQKTIINQKGEKVFINLKSTQKQAKGPMIITLNNNEIKLLKD